MTIAEIPPIEPVRWRILRDTYFNRFQGFVQRMYDNYFVSNPFYLTEKSFYKWWSELSNTIWNAAGVVPFNSDYLALAAVRELDSENCQMLTLLSSALHWLEKFERLRELVPHLDRTLAIGRRQDGVGIIYPEEEAEMSDVVFDLIAPPGKFAVFHLDSEAIYRAVLSELQIKYPEYEATFFKGLTVQQEASFIKTAIEFDAQPDGYHASAFEDLLQSPVDLESLLKQHDLIGYRSRLSKRFKDTSGEVLGVSEIGYWHYIDDVTKPTAGSLAFDIDTKEIISESSPISGGFYERCEDDDPYDELYPGYNFYYDVFPFNFSDNI